MREGKGIGLHCSCGAPIGDDGDRKLMLCGDCKSAFEEDIHDWYANLYQDQLRNEQYTEEAV